MSLARDQVKLKMRIRNNDGQLGVINGQVLTVFNIASDAALQTREPNYATLRCCRMSRMSDVSIGIQEGIRGFVFGSKPEKGK